MSTRIEKTGSKCRICGGAVVAKIVKIYNPMAGPPIIGPGGKNQYQEIHGGYYCEDCGIKYEFLSD